MGRKNRKKQNNEQRQMKYAVYSLLLAFALITFGVILYISAADAGSESGFHAFASEVIIPYCITVVILFIILTAIPIQDSLRCPECRRFFPKGKVIFNRDYQIQAPFTNNAGATYYRQTTVREYKTHCKYCGHTIFVRK